MTLIAEHIEPDTRERILEVALRLFREIGYQKTTVADIAKVLRMSPANVYRFFDSKKAIHEGVARSLMGEVEDAAQAIAARPGLAADRLRECAFDPSARGVVLLELLRRLRPASGLQRLVVFARLKPDDPRLALGPSTTGTQRAGRCSPSEQTAPRTSCHSQARCSVATRCSACPPGR